MQILIRVSAPVALLLLFTGCAAAPAKRDPRDPWERLNRATWAFNSSFDHHVALPVVHTYVRITPQFVRTGVSNFFANLNTSTTIANDVLQGQVVPFFSDTARLVLNSTLGLGGLLDPASSAGLPKNPRDFGQTLGKWGIGPGPFVMLPFVGPSDVRDTIGRVADGYTVPQTYVLNNFWPDEAGIWVAQALNTRYELLPQQPLIDKAYDPYVFIRSAYLQNREYKVNGGNSRKEEQEEENMLDELEQEDQTAPKPATSAPKPNTSPSPPR